ncbi:MAG TPA: LacI family DNA-binding transcriptional regulator [Opitutaceae bacterium]|nr:LacI family DNA-binding transcriptional regulator [Opitutaceae bacterium]
MKTRPSLVDVARRAKVNISTVSRTINQTGKIGLKTQERVRRVMSEMNYKPNRVARRLRTREGKSNLLGLVIPNIQNPFFADLARGVEDVAYENDFAVLLCNYDEDPTREQFYLDILQAESVDGIILPPIHENDAAVLQVVRNGTPIVCVDRSLSSAALDKVEVDNRRGSFEAVEYLIGLGHRNIGFIGGPADSSTGRERLAGYNAAHEKAGVPIKTQYVRFGDYKPGSGRRLAEELLSEPDPPTALFVCNCLMTVGALGTVYEMGLHIPDQIAIIGFDELPLASVFNPPLTVVRQPAYEVGKCAAELMIKRLDDPRRAPTSLMLSPELIIRKSC